MTASQIESLFFQSKSESDSLARNEKVRDPEIDLNSGQLHLELSLSKSNGRLTHARYFSLFYQLRHDHRSIQ